VKRPKDPDRINALVTAERAMARLAGAGLGSNPPFESHVVFSNWYGGQVALSAARKWARRLTGGLRVLFIPEKENISATLAAPGRITT